MNAQTSNTTQSLSAGKHHLLPRNPEAPIRTQIKDVVKQAVAYAMECGETPESALKMEAVLFGDHAPCALIEPEAFLCSITQLLTEQKRFLSPITGFRQLTPRDDRQPYKIELVEVDDDTDQQVYLLAVKRVGGTTIEKATEFWSYAIVCLATKGDSPALVISLDATFDEETYRFQNSSMYTRTINNPITSRPERVNFLATINLPTNLHGIAVDAARVAGFPLEQIQKNRQSREQRTQNWQSSRQVNQPRRELVPATNGASPKPVEDTDFSDPFSE